MKTYIFNIDEETRKKIKSAKVCKQHGFDFRYIGKKCPICHNKNLSQNKEVIAV